MLKCDNGHTTLCPTVLARLEAGEEWNEKCAYAPGAHAPYCPVPWRPLER